MGCKTPAAPATVSGEPSGQHAIGTFRVLEKAVRTGADPRARRPARRRRLSRGQGVPGGRGSTRMTTSLAAHGRGRCRASPTDNRIDPARVGGLVDGVPNVQICLRSSICLAALAVSSTALADEAATAHAVAADGDSIIVTATRAPLALDEIPSSIAVLDKAAIDRAQDIGVTELLLRTPSISISRNGGYGTSTSLRIRGAEPEHSVVVIDGVKLNDPSSTGGGFNFTNLLAGDISRIEVLRGPQSILWGSQAIGGVVNVVTASPEKNLEGSFDLEAGSRDTISARAALGGRTGPLSWRIGGQRFTTDGISSHAGAFGGVERDGYRNHSVSGRAELALADNVSAEVRGYYSSGRVEFDGFNTDSKDYGLNKEFVELCGAQFRPRRRTLPQPHRLCLHRHQSRQFQPRPRAAAQFRSRRQEQALGISGQLRCRRSASPRSSGSRMSVRISAAVRLRASLATPLPAFVRGKAELTQRLWPAQHRTGRGADAQRRHPLRRSRPLRRADPVRGGRRLAPRHRHDAARKLWRRLQGAGALPAVQRVRECRARPRGSAWLGSRHRAASAAIASWSSARPGSTARRRTRSSTTLLVPLDRPDVLRTRKQPGNAALRLLSQRRAQRRRMASRRRRR